MDIILEELEDKFYLIIKIGDVFFRHVRNSNTAIRMHTDWCDDIEKFYQYIKDNFYDYGRIELSADSTLLWVKERYRGSEKNIYEEDPHERLKMIVNELYSSVDAKHMLQSINGVVAAINGSNQKASRKELYHLGKLRFETDPYYREFVAHPFFERYVSNKLTSLIKKRKK